MTTTKAVVSSYDQSEVYTFIVQYYITVTKFIFSLTWKQSDV